MAINPLTTPDALEKIDALLADFQYVDDDRIVVTTGFVSSFYFWGGHVSTAAVVLHEHAVALRKSAMGLLIISGPTPDIAPIDQEMPAQRARINALLRPLRNGIFGSMGFGARHGEPRLNPCTSNP